MYYKKEKHANNTWKNDEICYRKNNKQYEKAVTFLKIFNNLK